MLKKSLKTIILNANLFVRITLGACNFESALISEGSEILKLVTIQFPKLLTYLNFLHIKSLVLLLLLLKFTFFSLKGWI